jgi:hypothetical protein
MFALKCSVCKLNILHCQYGYTLFYSFYIWLILHLVFYSLGPFCEHSVKDSYCSLIVIACCFRYYSLVLIAKQLISHCSNFCFLPFSFKGIEFSSINFIYLKANRFYLSPFISLIIKCFTIILIIKPSLPFPFPYFHLPTLLFF